MSDDTLASPRPDFAAYLEALPEPHILFDRHYRIVAANAAYRRQYAQGAPVVGRTCYEVSHHSTVPCDQAGETCPLARSLHSGQRERVLHLHHTPRGEDYVQIELLPLRDASGRAQYFLEKMEPLPVAQGHAGSDVGDGVVGGMLGRSPPFQAVLELIARVGPSQASVLLLGESGTGKELAARAVHEASPRAGRPLVVVDCASLPETLFESELFGHERGAFTGAHTARAGLVEAAHGGTLFLDEVGDIPLTMQVKLLRLLESGTYRRVGQTELRRAAPTCAWWLPRTATCAPWWRRGAFGKTCTTAWQPFPSCCPHCASARKTFRCWPGRCWTVWRRAAAWPWRLPPCAGWCSTHFLAMCANCETCSSAPRC